MDLVMLRVHFLSNTIYKTIRVLWALYGITEGNASDICVSTFATTTKMTEFPILLRMMNIPIWKVNPKALCYFWWQFSTSLSRQTEVSVKARMPISILSSVKGIYSMLTCRCLWFYSFDTSTLWGFISSFAWFCREIVVVLGRELYLEMITS